VHDSARRQRVGGKQTVPCRDPTLACGRIDRRSSGRLDQAYGFARFGRQESRDELRCSQGAVPVVGLAESEADRFDTPEVSRWTWMLGAGWANLLVGRNEAAVGWLERSVAITPASGRAHLLLAAAYQRLGRSEEARKAFTKAMEIRPDSTARNISLPARNASDVYLRARQDINRILVQLGLPS